MKQASHPPSQDTSHHLPFALNTKSAPLATATLANDSTRRRPCLAVPEYAIGLVAVAAQCNRGSTLISSPS